MAGKTLLDIGGGIGVVDHELLAAGATSALHVDASAAFASAAAEEATRRGVRDRIEFRQGDFVAIAPEIPPADVVTLDRVICCYANMELLVRESASHAKRLYGFVIPRERWITRMGRFGVNTMFRLMRNQFRFHIHPISEIDRVLADSGFHAQAVSETIFWRVAVYARAAA